MFKYVFAVFIIIWEIINCTLLVGAFAEKRKYRHRAVFYVIFACGAVMAYLISFLLFDFLLFKIIANIILYIALMYFLFRDKILKFITLVFLYYGVGIICDYSVVLIVGKITSFLPVQQMDDTQISYLMAIISRILFLILVILVRHRFGKQKEDVLTVSEWLGFLIVPVFTVISLIAIILKFNLLYQYQQDNVLLYIALGMAAMNIVVFFLMEGIIKREKAIRETQLMAEKMKNETELYYSMAANLEKQRKLSHEFRNHIDCIGELLRNEEYRELEDYYAKLDKEILFKTELVDTNHVIINAVVNTKYREAMEKGIVFILKVNDLSGIKLSDMESVTILSNLLNNAIEACEEYEGDGAKRIKLKFVIEDGQTIISVKNTTSHKPVIKDGEIRTSKSHTPEEHGMGIKNVIEVVERHGGKYLIECEGDEFSFSIVM